nr:MAG TPA: hypothetical protein [Caudoviricetes sp.]
MPGLVGYVNSKIKSKGTIHAYSEKAYSKY